MYLYFVRHGETDDNADNIHQTETSQLSQHGLRQAEFLAQRCQKLPIELIVSSHFKRTQQTAEIIAEQLGKAVVYNELFKEIKRPSVIEGLRNDNPEAVAVKELQDQHGHESAWHYSDEENFHDVARRCQAALNFLEQQPAEHILIVTHGIVIRMIICDLLLADALTFDFFKRIRSFFRHKNTGITIIEKNASGRWQLITWNDHAHLG